MSHLDEGTLHALLDGELELTEVKEIQAHLGGCAACGSRLREVKEFLAESDRLVSTVQFPGELRPPSPVAPAAVPPVPAGNLRERERARRAEPDTAPPVLLIPENPDFDVRPKRWFGMVRWAAVLAVAVGAGYLASQMRRGGTASSPALAYKQAEPASPAPDSGAVASQVETSQSQAPADSRVRLDSAARELAAVARRSRSSPASSKKANSDRTVAPSKLEAAPKTVAVREEPLDKPKDAAAEATGTTEDSTAALLEERDSFDPAAANAAMAELDRERRLQRAKAATAQLDAQQRARQAAAREVAPAAAAAPAPLAPRTLEQRSQVYLRIGLDEAARQLGGPVHVIEGLSPAFMGLAQGRISPGADSTRPVVRVVYQDSQGRMIVLDQQRIRPGQTGGTSDSGWNYGDIRLSLFGEVGPEVLRNLRPRVR